MAGIGRVSFVAYGDPRPKGSMRGFVVTDKRTGKHRAIVTQGRTSGVKEWQALVGQRAQAVAGGAFWGGEAVEVRVIFCMRRPASVSEAKRPHPTTKPDADKLLRAILDALKGVLYQDDAQICRLVVGKKYVASGPPCVHVQVGLLEGELDTPDVAPPDQADMATVEPVRRKAPQKRQRAETGLF